MRVHNILGRDPWPRGRCPQGTFSPKAHVSWASCSSFGTCHGGLAGFWAASDLSLSGVLLFVHTCAHILIIQQSALVYAYGSCYECLLSSYFSMCTIIICISISQQMTTHISFFFFSSNSSLCLSGHLAILLFWIFMAWKHTINIIIRVVRVHWLTA